MNGRSNEIRLMQRMINLIKEEKVVHNFELRERLNISKTQYNAIKPDLEHRFGWQVIYDKKSKCWRYVGVETTKEIEEKQKNAL